MKLSAADQKAFPAFRYYIQHDMPEVAKVPAIIHSIAKLAGKTGSPAIKKALKWGNSPTIKIVHDLRDGGKKCYGLYDWGSDVLQIDKHLVQEFCNGRGVVKTAGGRRIYLVGATVLHELTHWADAMDGTDDAVPGDPTNEEGNAFEEDIYGGITG